jgi:phage shock protein C
LGNGADVHRRNAAIQSEAFDLFRQATGIRILAPILERRLLEALMSRYDDIPHRRFYRNADKAMIAGVCAGLADYFGFNLRATRFLAFLSLVMAMPVTLLVYFATVFLVPSAPDISRETNVDAKFRQALRSSPAQTVSDVKRRFQSLDSRLARLERYVTSPKFDLDQEFRRL